MQKLFIFFIATNLFAGDILNDAIVSFGSTQISIMMIIKFLSIFVIGFTLGWIYKYKIINSKKIGSRLSNSTKTLLANIGYYFIVFLTIVTSFNSIGLNLSSLTVVAGALSVGIGFGLQNIVSNFIAGIILLFEKTIEVGHFIELQNGVRGTVRDIKLRATIITTGENADIIVPNSMFIQNSVTNLTLIDEMLRIKIPFSVAYGTKIEYVQELILNTIKNPELPHVQNDIEKEPKVWFVNMNNSGLDFELILCIIGDNAKKKSTILSTYLTIIYNTLNQSNINIPYPQLDINVKELPRK